jgi:hypothetical protein
MTATRCPAPAEARQRTQLKTEETLTGLAAHEMNTIDLSAAKPADIKLVRRPALDRNAGRHRVRTVAGFRLESVADFAGIHSLQLTAEPSAVGRSSR